MSNLRNKVQLIGNVGSTPEITNLNTSKKVAHLSIATNDYYYNKKGESVQDTQWHNLVAWNKNAELIENYVPKGKLPSMENLSPDLTSIKMGLLDTNHPQKIRTVS